MQGVDARSAAPRAARAARLPKARDVVGVDLEVDGRALWVGLERLRRSFAPAHACGGMTFQRCGPLPNLPAGAWSHTGLHARSQQAGRGATAIWHPLHPLSSAPAPLFQRRGTRRRAAGLNAVRAPSALRV